MCLLATGGAGQLFDDHHPNPVHWRRRGDGDASRRRRRRLRVLPVPPDGAFAPAVDAPPSCRRHCGTALLLDRHGDRFVDELKPRDVVSRAMTRTMLDQDVDHLEHGARRRAWSSIAVDLTAAGLDPAKDWLPVAPAWPIISAAAYSPTWTALPRCPACGPPARPLPP